MNKKAFTLVETLAVIVLLSIILLIAVPSVTRLLEENKKRNFSEDAKRFLATVENEVERNTEIEYPEEGRIKVFKLEYFNETDFKKSPYTSDYNEEKSFVTLEVDNNQLIYKVHMIACNDSKCYVTKEVTEEGTTNLFERDQLNKNKIMSVDSSEVDQSIETITGKTQENIEEYNGE